GQLLPVGADRVVRVPVADSSEIGKPATRVEVRRAVAWCAGGTAVHRADAVHAESRRAPDSVVKVLVVGTRDGRVRIERVPRGVERGHDEAAPLDAARPLPTRGIVAKKSCRVAVRGRSESADADLESGHLRGGGCQEGPGVVERPIHERFDDDAEAHGGRTYHHADALSRWWNG